VYRRRKEDRILKMKGEMSKIKKQEEELLDPEVRSLVEKRKKELEKRREVKKAEMKDKFYEHIDEERRKELNDIVYKKRKVITEEDMKKWNLE
jgi:hypothetical protein